MEIIKYTSNLLKSNMYVVKEKNHAIIIDPCVIELDRNVCYDAILLTHEHYDHISGVNRLKEEYNIPVYGSLQCKLNCQSTKKNLSGLFDIFCELQSWIDDEEIHYVDEYTCEVDISFENNIQFNWMGHSIRMIECPGHSGGSCLIIVDNIIFSGDSILRDFDTETRFPGGSKKKWKNESEPFISGLDKSMVVYPGHFDSFTLKDSIISRQSIGRV